MPLRPSSLCIVSSKLLAIGKRAILCHMPLLLTNIARPNKRSGRLSTLRGSKMLHRSKRYRVHRCHHTQTSTKKVLRGRRYLHLGEHSQCSLWCLPDYLVSHLLLRRRHPLLSSEYFLQLLHGPAMRL